MLRIKNKTFERYLRNKDKIKAELDSYQKELDRSFARQEKLREMIRWREDLLATIEYGGEYIKHHGILLSVNVGTYPNGEKYATVKAPGNDCPKFAKVYTNANDDTKYGCQIYQEVPYRTSKERFLGANFEDFDALVQLCMDWAVGLEVENFFCGECLVKASCTDTRCHKKIFTGMD